jgi:Domain of unknown function (DUF6817)
MPSVAHNTDVQGLEKVAGFLKQRTAGVRHSGREFYEHLRGVYDILAERGNPEYVCLAGLFHSIYGTNSFKTGAMPRTPEGRLWVAKQIGDEAEALVFIFCTVDRPRAFVNNTGKWNARTLRDLLEIEFANLTEQGADTKVVERRMEFERCWPWLEASLLEGSFERPDGTKWPTHEKHHVWERIVNGKSLFWPRAKCAAITEFHTAPTGLKSHHTWLSGGDKNAALSAVKELQFELEEFGRKNGSHRQTGSGRRGWLWAFEGYREIGVRKSKSLI